ncbi:DNA-binding transcriptional LysR family regulator [Actinocorallia herbida]|uniref:DNA-binding transcriptional LysR family regulator n=1 Tax=Actinocorallia herbida TaxID=58109 RepID=A0A3N1CUF6_9ACTN|nr:LysR family transcriptional regulator [Actinocorallia herbida]ROO84844.1 DNA-binding transcriptional LysR family regulator [Actinocorallia herbida]
MLDVRKLRLLRELAHRGTIAAVAEALSYTPSAVSQQLAALERETGVALLERTGRRVTLTLAARALAARTEPVLAALAEAEAELAAYRTGLTGTLRVGAFPTAVRTVLSPALVTLSRTHPGLELRVSELDPAAVPDALRADAIDVALVHEYDFTAGPDEPGLETEPLMEETVHLAALAAGPLRAHRAAPWIAGTPGTLCHTMTVRACEAEGFTPRIRHHADDFGAVLALVAAGQGVALVPDLGLLDPPPGLVLTPLATRRRTRIAYRRGHAAHPLIAAARTALHTTRTPPIPPAVGDRGKPGCPPDAPPPLERHR